MELREFISETLTQIAQGVKDAQSIVAELGAKVNPEISMSGQRMSFASPGWLVWLENFNGFASDTVEH